MPPGTELDNLQRQADMVDNAKNNLEIETAEDVKKQIDLTLSQGGRKRLEDKGIDVDKFISRYDELFGGDITTILDEADKVIQGTEEIDKIVDESDIASAIITPLSSPSAATASAAAVNKLLPELR